MQKAKLYGVELDSITGRIAKQLYQQADIKIMGYEETDTPDAFFDAAIGNVPFGSYKVMDRRYDQYNFLIHDYFFAKTLDQVRPGGVIAFVTSMGTLDKTNATTRRYLAQRAELLGAVRLPNNAFSKNAGTDVTCDIVFLQKRDCIVDIEPDWVHLGETKNGIPINSYFADNPHMVLGTMSTESGTRMYGRENAATCIPIEGADLSEQLKTALSYITGQITEVVLDDLGAESTVRASIPADPTVKNYSYSLVAENELYYRENSRMFLVDMPAATMERIRGMVQLRDVVRTLIDMQLHNHHDHDIQAQQQALNATYEAFTIKHGLISSTANAKAFKADSSYHLLSSLEILDEEGKLTAKSDIFTKRTINQHKEITFVDTSSEALAVSIARRACVDMGLMVELTGFSEEKIVSDLQGVIFRNLHVLPDDFSDNPALYLESCEYVAADEYLSGNVREKLAIAKHVEQVLRAAHPAQADNLQHNINALENAQPKDLEASEISVRLGSTWVDQQYVQQFVYELLETPPRIRDLVNVHYSEYTGEWSISGKSIPSQSDVLACTTYGTRRVNAYKIIEDTLNLKDVRVYDTFIVDGKEQRVLNKKETALAAQKQDAIKVTFQDWIWKDPSRRQALVSHYNQRFNATRIRQYDGQHINFVGINTEEKLRKHQVDAVARVMYGGNTLLAHEVGAGKTWVMVASAMESKRLGLCSKSMMVVPNHIIEDTASQFLRLYPSANILVASKKDFEPKSRKRFCARIATGDYDCVIIGHSQFEKIPLSKERQERLIKEQISDITLAIQEIKRAKGERFTIKSMEKTKKSLETRLAKLNQDGRKDDVVTFEQLGVDRLFVDESHAYKNLYLVTKMRNVAGISTTESQKASDLFMKCRYMDELTGGKGIIFATGTPVSNNMAELYTVQRYLQYDTLKSHGLATFDAWASTFGETVTAIELAPEGTGYRARTRFAKFQNLPELMGMIGAFADIKTTDTLGLPLPRANYLTIVAKPTKVQRGLIAELSKRAKAVHDKQVDPSQDNMLKITGDGRKIGLDQRLINDRLPDDPGSKLNLCMENVYRIWEDSLDTRLTQLVFCDTSTPSSGAKFNVYSDIRTKLLAKGIPAEEIAFIHDYNTEVQKKELFAKVRNGKVRILFGSTQKMGAGTNLQDRLIAIHDLDAPWRPSDLEQRAGRIVRQGNQNPEVSIFRYVTESTFDSYLFQTLEKKQTFISQIMTSKTPVRTCDDIDEDVLSYAEIKALCAGNPHIKEKMQLDIEVSKLRILKADHQSQHYRLQDSLLQEFPRQMEALRGRIAGLNADMTHIAANTHLGESGISPMTIFGESYTDRNEAGAALLTACQHFDGMDSQIIGNYRGLEMHISYSMVAREFVCTLKGAISHAVVLGSDEVGNITRINYALGKTLPQCIASAEDELKNIETQVANAKTELKKPFPREQDLVQKSARLTELDALLNIGNDEDIQGQEGRTTHRQAETR